MDGHGAGLYVAENLRNFLFVKRLDFVKGGDVVGKLRTGNLRRSEGCESIQEVAEDEFVGVAISGRAFQLHEEDVGGIGIVAREVGAEATIEFLEAFVIFFEKHPRGGAHALVVAFIEGVGMVHENDDFAVGGDGFVHDAGDGRWGGLLRRICVQE